MFSIFSAFKRAHMCVCLKGVPKCGALYWCGLLEMPAYLFTCQFRLRFAMNWYAFGCFPENSCCLGPLISHSAILCTQVSDFIWTTRSCGPCTERQYSMFALVSILKYMHLAYHIIGILNPISSFIHT